MTTSSYQAKKILPLQKIIDGLQIIRLDATNLVAIQEIVKKFGIEIISDLAIVPLPTSHKYPNWTVTTILGIASTICELARREMFKSLIHFQPQKPTVLQNTYLWTRIIHTMSRRHTLVVNQLLT